MEFDITPLIDLFRVVTGFLAAWTVESAVQAAQQKATVVAISGIRG